MDDHRKAVYKSLGWMKSLKCTCCNWTLSRKRKESKRAVNKQARAKLKASLRKQIKELDK